MITTNLVVSAHAARNSKYYDLEYFATFNCREQGVEENIWTKEG
jgi:hypothetical protein